MPQFSQVPKNRRAAYLEMLRQSRTQRASSLSIEDQVEQRNLTDCMHRGAQSGVTACQSCGGKRNLPTFQCTEHGTCTVTRRAADQSIRFCGDCPDASPVWITRTYAELHDDLVAWSERLPILSGVCGIPRSGVPAASMLSLLRNIPLISYDSLRARTETYRRPDGRGLREIDQAPVLVVDDTSWSGSAMRRARKDLEGVQRPLMFGAVYAGKRGLRQCDVHFERFENWHHTFEWNVGRDTFTQHSMLDLDGVIAPDPTCRDFTGNSNEPTAAYLKHITEAVPQRWPSMEVHTICTARLERFRSETEAWLKRHGIRFRNLIMHPGTTWQEREREGHAVYKAKHYAASSCKLFVESNPQQAAMIHELTGRAVISTKPFGVYQTSGS